MKIFSYDEALTASLKYFNNNELAAKVFIDKYALRNKDDKLLENNPGQMHRRIAKEFARIEKNKFKNPLSEEEIYSYLKGFKKIIPQGSPMAGIGNNEQYLSLSNCYVLTTPEDSYGGILSTDEEVVHISRRRGGVGISLNNLRPCDTPVQNAARSSTGIVSWMQRYSNTIREVGQHGRRGAMMQTLSVHHPDIKYFIDAKKDLTKITGANISVQYTDEFLEAVDKNKDYEQRWPIDSKNPIISKMVRARDIWKLTVDNAWSNGEPGLQFWSNIINQSITNCYKEFGFGDVSSNPCCFSQQHCTYVITNSGIKEIQNITSDDLIWINETKQWVKNSGYISYNNHDVIKLQLKNGEELFVTSNHKFCIPKLTGKKKYNVNEYAFKIMKDLKKGDAISLHTSEVKNDIWQNKIGTYNEGLILGWLTGDGYLSFNKQSHWPVLVLDFWNHEFDVAEKLHQVFIHANANTSLMSHKYCNKKTISSISFSKYFIEKYQYNIWNFKSQHNDLSFLFDASKEFIQGFLQSYFTADGYIACPKSKKPYIIELSSINKPRLNQVRYLLHLFGITSTIHLAARRKLRDFGPTRGGICQTQDIYRLRIFGKHNLTIFDKQIGFLSSLKQSRLNQALLLVSSREAKHRNYTTIDKITNIGKYPVGCIEVYNHHKFSANGVISGNSELPLCELDSCRLLLINLFNYVKKPFSKNAAFNYKDFYKDAIIAQRLMDDLVDLELEAIDRIINKVENKDKESIEIRQREINLWKKIRKKCIDGRRTGTGITALGDTLAALNIKYGTRKSINITDKIYKTLKLGCYRSSVDIAKEIGAFPIFNNELEKNNNFLLRIKQEDPNLYNDMQKYGRRNIALLTTSPAGSVSLLAQLLDGYFGTTSGIEPLFMQQHTRRKKGNPGDKEFRSDFIDKNDDHWMQFDINHAGIELWKKITNTKDTTGNPYENCCAEDIDWQNRVKLQSVAQKHIDHSISSTINLPENISKKEVNDIYLTAWKSGCKGITVYRKGCRDGVLIEKNKDDKLPEGRPKTVVADIHHHTVKGLPYIVFVGLVDNKPYEVFANASLNGDIDRKIKSGKIIKVRKNRYKAIIGQDEICPINALNDENEDALVRMISTNLQSNCDLSVLIKRLDKTQGSMVSLIKAISRALKKYIPDGSKEEGTCPDCGSSSLRRESGCIICVCGYSACS